jgi:uncharacterized membrane protein
MRLILNKWHIALWGCILSYSILFSLLGIWRHWGYLTSLYDLGCYDQAIWTASQGGSLLNSFNGTGQTMNWLGIHFQPILYLFVPLYKLYPSVHWLTVSQSAALAFSALPMFAIARHVTRSEKNAFLWALIYLLNPFVIAAATWDFHEVSLATFFISLGLYAITQKRLLLLMISSIFLLACKEHFGLTVAGLGVLYGVVHKNWLVGTGFSVVGIMMTALIIGVLMPHYSPTGQHLMIMPVKSMDSSSMRYAWLGNSAASIIENLLMHPLKVMETAFVTMQGWVYLFGLLTPFLLLPVASPVWLIPIVGDLLANLLSANPMPRNIFSYHSVTIIPFLTLAAIFGLQKVHPCFKSLSAEGILKLTLCLELILAYYVAPLPLLGSVNFWRPLSVITPFDEREAAIKEIIGNGVISIQANLGAHFTQRFSIYGFPEKIDESDFIVLRLESPTLKTIPDDPGEIGTIAHHLHLHVTDYLKQVEKLLNDNKYDLLYWNDPWVIFGKGPQKSSSASVESVRSKIQELRRSWQTVKPHEKQIL